VLTLGTVRKLELDERRDLEGLYGIRREERYDGWLEVRVLNVRRAVLYWILLCTGSQ
jgi:hypothetical protein